jgi:hypothetical protein
LTQFLFHLWNHTDLGKRSLEDVIGIFGKQLRALGHTAIWHPENDRRPDVAFIGGAVGYNVIVEGFTPYSIDIIARAHANGGRFICLATEEPTATGFNHGTQREMAWRQELFPAAARFFDGILHFVPGDAVTRWYGQFAPTAPIELGYAPELVRRQLIHEPEFDFGFFGSISKRRRALLIRLGRTTRRRVAVLGDFATQNDRDRAMQNAKVIVQLRKFEEMGLVSSSRCNTALCNGRPIVAEPHDAALSKPWDEIVQFSRDIDEFILRASVVASCWRETHQKQFEAFARLLPPEECVGRALRAIGVDGLRVAA